MNLLRTLLGRDEVPARSFDMSWLPDFAQWSTMFNQTLIGTSETIDNNFAGYVRGAYKRGGVVAAVMTARMYAIGQVRFLFQEFGDDGRPGEFHWDPKLNALRRPQQLLARMDSHNSLGGNAYVVNHKGRYRTLRPDWVTIVRASYDSVDDPMDADLIGYTYTPGGPYSGQDPVVFLPHQVAHYAPLPDPEAEYRGMSWLTPVLRQIQSHQAAAGHKEKFFVNGATPNLAVKVDPSKTIEQIKEFKKLFDEQHQGVANAYKTMFLGGGMDPVPIGMDFNQLDFKSVQGADETLIAASGGVPPIIANLSEGLAQATYSNYGQAKRHFNDTTVSFLAGEIATALETLASPPENQRLWYDIRDVPFFRDDAKSEAEVQQMEAAIIRNLTDGGWEPNSIIAAIKAQGDWSKLVHTGKLSVQLQEPGATPPAPETEGTP